MSNDLSKYAGATPNTVDIPDYIRDAVNGKNTPKETKLDPRIPTPMRTPMAHNLRKAAIKVLNMYIEDNGGRGPLRHYNELHGFPVAYPPHQIQSEAAAVNTEHYQPDELFKERGRLMVGGNNPTAYSTEAARLSRNGARYYTSPSSFPLIRALGYLYLQGWRWVKYETLDGVVVGFEQKQPLNNIPIPLRAEYRLIADFRQLVGISLAACFNVGRVKEITNNTSAVYISLSN